MSFGNRLFEKMLVVLASTECSHGRSDSRARHVRGWSHVGRNPFRATCSQTKAGVNGGTPPANGSKKTHGIYIYIYTHTHMHMCACAHTHALTYLYICIILRVYVRMRTFIDTHEHAATS